MLFRSVIVFTTRPIYKNNNQISFILKDILNEHENIYEDALTKNFNSDIENIVIYSDVPIKTNLSTILNNFNNNITQWINDSGASIHITYQKDLLKDIKQHHKEITLSNRNKELSNYIGNIEGYINNNKVILKDVLYIQNFKRNIISISKLIEQKYKFLLNINNGKPQTVIYSPNGKRIFTIYSNENNNTFQL